MYASKRRNTPELITISYDPEPLPEDLELAQTDGACLCEAADDCQIDKYRLIMKGDDLTLIAVTTKSGEEKACDGVTELTAWKVELGGIFTPSYSHCLRVKSDGTSLYASGKGSAVGKCTSKNEWNDVLEIGQDNTASSGGGGGWHFTQKDGGENLCMHNLRDADKRKAKEISQFYVGDTDCGNSWKKAVFEPGPDSLKLKSHSDISQQTDLSEKTCNDCLNGPSATPFQHCLSEDMCRAAPTVGSCTSGKGQWCKAEPSIRICANGTDDWMRKSYRRKCDMGCDQDTCITKKTDKGEPARPCVTQAHYDNGDYTPNGCDYGSNENTCAYDEHHVCRYSDLGNAGTDVSV